MRKAIIVGILATVAAGVVLAARQLAAWRSLSDLADKLRAASAARTGGQTLEDEEDPEDNPLAR